MTNGARGEIVDIILHRDEPPLSNELIVTLNHFPSYILVKMQRTCASQLDRLGEGIISIEVATCNFQIKVCSNGGKYVTQSVCCHQFPMTAVYGFTDYRSQGQTLPYVIVDITTPPTGRLNLFNLYVALSQSSGRETIQLLRDFDNDLFNKSHDPALLAEYDRLEQRDKITKAWWQRMGWDKRRHTDVSQKLLSKEIHSGQLRVDLAPDSTVDLVSISVVDGMAEWRLKTLPFVEFEWPLCSLHIYGNILWYRIVYGQKSK